MTRFSFFSLLLLLTTLHLPKEVTCSSSSGTTLPLDLTDATYPTTIDGSKDALVMFYAEWCGHCKKLKPTYAQLAETFATRPSVLIAMIDADKYRQTVSKVGIQGYPTIKFFSKRSGSGEKYDDKGVEYHGNRSLESLVKFVEEKMAKGEEGGEGEKKTDSGDELKKEL